MQEVLDLKEVVEDIISSYEKRIEGMGSILDTTSLIFNDFQNSILDTKEEREKINNQLRDFLAKNENLRKKDFNNMMQAIFQPQDEKEKELRDFLSNYFNEQKQIAYSLKDNFTMIRNAFAKGEIEKIKQLLDIIKELLAKQDKGKETLILALKELQKEQKDVVTSVKALLIKGRQLRISDLKEMLMQLKLQRKERMAERLQRQQEVSGMLSNFKKQRIEIAKKWRRPQRVVNLPKAVDIDGKKEPTKEG